MRILVTGATGYVGRYVVDRLSGEHELVAAVRSQDSAAKLPAGVQGVITGDFAPDTDWTSALDAVDVVVHLAARAHVLKETETDAAAAFRRVNYDGTMGLARAAEKSGVKRFLFMSSVKVNGTGQPYNYTGPGYSGKDKPEPEDLFAFSKLEAENDIRKLNIESTVIRPPLVYGATAPGNLRNLLKLMWKSLPLPLASTKNRRSFVSGPNLADFVATCVAHPGAANQIFTVCDSGTVSTAELLRLLGEGMGKPAKLFPFPVGLAQALANAARKKKVFDSLFGSLVLDENDAKSGTGWVAPHPLKPSLLSMAKQFREDQEKSTTPS